MKTKQAHYLSQILMWCYENDIEVRFFKQISRNDSWAILRFSRNGRHAEQAFHPLTDSQSEYYKHITMKMAYALLVPEFKPVEYVEREFSHEPRRE